MSIFETSGLGLAASVRAGEVSSRELVEAHIDKIERVNATLNAVVWKRYEQARAEADRVDAAVRRGETEDFGVYAGVPCTVKECFSFAGKPHTSGLVARRGWVAREDATAIQRMRSVGAIPLGGTNVSELCMWMESDNLVYGRTNNPYDPSRIVGGSSGGEGAIIGAGASPFGLGSDVGGSIRMPAFFNGVFGHKPSGGMVPNTGQFPLAENEALRYCTVGPLARRSVDLFPLLRAMAGPDGHDTFCADIALGDPDAVDVGALRVIDIPHNGVVRVHPDLRAAQERVRDVLSAKGAKVETRCFAALEESLSIWMAMLQAAGGKTFSHMLFEGRQPSLARELVRFALGRSSHTLPALGLALVERIGPKARGLTERSLELGRQLRSELDEALGTDGVLLYPPYSEPAPKHGAPFRPPLVLKPKGAWRHGAHISAKWSYTAVLNVMELPVTQVPLGLNDAGLPVGVQIGAGYGNDHITIAVARLLEEEFGGWVPPWEAGPHAVR